MIIQGCYCLEGKEVKIYPPKTPVFGGNDTPLTIRFLKLNLIFTLIKLNPLHFLFAFEFNVYKK
jgi:hypothetical protein